ncbi:glycosyltransferase [Arthrobacter sp. H41]|uniref:glycosyltransferase n=1 Tax=Arthrobacter sp. H41 TaxID=1312978 RepID=UPI0004AFCB2A|nr:glycosyltransferase [Arthrobacter sp. H41]
MSAAATDTLAGKEKAVPAYRVVQRVVLPLDGDTDVLPLYVDFNSARRVVEHTKRAIRRGAPKAPENLPESTHQRSDFIVGRWSLRLPAFRRISLGTYFNAFPASYWRKHTDIRSVRLTVEVDAEATVIVYRSSPRGVANRVDSAHVLKGQASFDLPVTAFVDGGWYWFDLVAHGDNVTLLGASWAVEESKQLQRGSVSVAVTTFNRPDYALRHISTLADDAGVMEVLDRLIIVDQGTDKVRLQEGYSDAAAQLGEKFLLVEQANIGGSGGFARGMHETLEAGDSTYVLLLDDDVSIETEGILRAVNFADFTTRPTIVGGHMFNLYERSVLHTFGEQVDQRRFFWGPAANTREGHDFAASNLRTSPWMHRRVDVDYNGWWMCMIPTSIVREVGLSLPVFIKWDDAEYGLRAQQHGYRTVTLPGAAVWHMPWTEKDDTIDWQAYYHQRNRWVATLSHSSQPKGGRMPFESFAIDVRHLLSMQYSAVEVRLKALEDVLSGPDHLHRTIGERLPWIRATRATFSDAQIKPDRSAFPEVRPPSIRREVEEPVVVAESIRRAGLGALRQFRAVDPKARAHPQAEVPAMDARWWRLTGLDSALVSSSDGSGSSWYRRDRKQFVRMLLRTMALHRSLLLRWNTLSADYHEALPRFTGREAWAETFTAAAVPGEEPKVL